jgi:hypothetical protein
MTMAPPLSGTAERIARLIFEATPEVQGELETLLRTGPDNAIGRTINELMTAALGRKRKIVKARNRPRDRRFWDWHNKGQSYAAIAEKANRLGWKNERGGEFTRGAVKRAVKRFEALQQPVPSRSVASAVRQG